VSTINERCSCGATFQITDEWVPSMRQAVDEWRKGHRCRPRIEVWRPRAAHDPEPTKPKEGEFGTRGSGGGTAKPPKHPPPPSGKKGSK
jgi:hypothetical protein